LRLLLILICVLITSACFSKVSIASFNQEQKLTASDGVANSHLGSSISMTPDGTRIAVGADQTKIGTNIRQGAVYVFSRSGTTWTQEQELTASDGAAGYQFGASTGISFDGSRIVVGANGAKIGSNTNQGAAYVFSRSGTTWTQEQELTASDGTANYQFGASASISSDGFYLIVGAAKTKVGTNSQQGAAYVFSRSGTTWTQEQELTASDGAVGDNLGNWPSISSDDSHLVVGEYQGNNSEMAPLMSSLVPAPLGRKSKNLPLRTEKGMIFLAIPQLSLPMVLV